MSSVSSTDGGYQYYQRPVSDLEDDIKADNERARQRYEERVQSLQAAHNRELRDHDAELERTAQSIRDNTNDQYQRSSEASRRDLEETKAKLYDRYGRVGESDEEARKNYQASLDAITQDYEHQLDNSRKAQEEQAREISESADARNEKRLAELRDAQAAQTRDLHNQIHELQEWAEPRHSEANRRASEFVKNYENEYRTQKATQQLAHEQEVDKLHRSLAETVENDSRAKTLAMREQANRYGNLMRNQTLEHRKEIQDLQADHARDRTELQHLSQRALAAQATANEQRVASVQQHADETLQKQADAFNDAQARNRKASNAQIRQLENKLQVKETSSDPNEVSPNAEATIRRSIGAQYQKQFDEEQARNERRRAELRDNYKNDVDTLRNQNHSNEMKLNGQRTMEAHQDLARYRDYLDDAQHDKEESIRQTNRAHDRQTNLQAKLNARELDGQRRQYEEMFDTLRTQSSARVQGTKEDLDFKYKMAQREFAQKYGEQGRSYERKMRDQRDQYELMLANQKADHEKMIREIEQKNRTASEEQERASAQRMATVEQQYKERERRLAESYEDELDKVRRSNALLMQKKS